MITTGMGSKKIEGSDNWRAIFGAHNDTVEASDDHLDAIQDGLAIVANGDTHPAVAAGQFVYVRNHSTLAEGLYKAAAAIAEDALLNTSNLVADGAGGLNDLKGSIDTLNSNLSNKSKVDFVDITITNDNGVSVSAGTSYTVSYENFLSAYVIGSNSLVAMPYTYSNLIYCRLKNMEDMTNAVKANYTVRVWYRAN